MLSLKIALFVMVAASEGGHATRYGLLLEVQGPDIGWLELGPDGEHADVGLLAVGESVVVPVGIRNGSQGSLALDVRDLKGIQIRVFREWEDIHRAGASGSPAEFAGEVDRRTAWGNWSASLVTEAPLTLGPSAQVEAEYELQITEPGRYSVVAWIPPGEPILRLATAGEQRFGLLTAPWVVVVKESFDSTGAAWRALVKARRATGRNDSEALGFYDEALRARPGLASVLFERAFTLQRMGRLREAVGDYRGGLVAAGSERPDPFAQHSEWETMVEQARRQAAALEKELASRGSGVEP